MSYTAWLHGTVCHASDVHEVMMSHNVYSVCGDHILFCGACTWMPAALTTWPGLLGGILMYLWHASLCHLPNIFICFSGIPASIAEVAAPIQKLCVLQLHLSSFNLERMQSNSVLNVQQVSIFPLLAVKHGPGLFLQIARYCR